MSDEQTSRKALGGAALMCKVAWEAIKAVGLAKNPAALEAFEKRLSTGKATLAIFIQRDAEQLQLTAAALPAQFETVFDAPLLRIQGPVVDGVAELYALSIVKPKDVN